MLLPALRMLFLVFMGSEGVQGKKEQYRLSPAPNKLHALWTWAPTFCISGTLHNAWQGRVSTHVLKMNARCSLPLGSDSVETER